MIGYSYNKRKVRSISEYIFLSITYLELYVSGNELLSYNLRMR